MDIRVFQKLIVEKIKVIVIIIIMFKVIFCALNLVTMDHLYCSKTHKNNPCYKQYIVCFAQLSTLLYLYCTFFYGPYGKDPVFL